MHGTFTHDPNLHSLSTRLAGKAARFAARRFCSRPLALSNVLPMVSFTFDDVPVSACEAGAGILEEHGGRGTFFVAGRDCGVTSPGTPPRASIADLNRVWSSGHEIGCHTFSHHSVRYMSLDQLGSDIDRNQAVLDTIGSNIVVRNFAYPYGDLSTRAKRYLETRFDSCRSGHAGVNTTIADLGALKACPLDSFSFDREKICRLIDATVQSRGWLIFYSHDVAEPPGRYGISPEILEWTVSRAQDAGCVLTTIAEGLRLTTATARAQ